LRQTHENRVEKNLTGLLLNTRFLNEYKSLAFFGVGKAAGIVYLEMIASCCQKNYSSGIFHNIPVKRGFDIISIDIVLTADI